MPAGRPSKYNAKIHPQAAKILYELGATDQKLIEAFNISESTLTTWKNKYPEFLASLKEGKDVADEKVIAALYMKATGYPDVRVKAKDGKEEIIHFKAPDTTACIFWLKNRKPEEWRDVQYQKHGVDEEVARLVAGFYPNGKGN